MFNYTIAPYHILSRGFWLTLDNGANRIVELIALVKELDLAQKAEDWQHVAVIEAVIEDTKTELRECGHACETFLDMFLS